MLGSDIALGEGELLIQAARDTRVHQVVLGNVGQHEKFTNLARLEICEPFRAGSFNRLLPGVLDCDLYPRGLFRLTVPTTSSQGVETAGTP